MSIVCQPLYYRYSSICASFNYVTQVDLSFVKRYMIKRIFILLHSNNDTVLTGKRLSIKSLNKNFIRYMERNSNILYFNLDLFNSKRVYSSYQNSFKKVKMSFILYQKKGFQKKYTKDIQIISNSWHINNRVSMI